MTVFNTYLYLQDLPTDLWHHVQHFINAPGDVLQWSFNSQFNTHVGRCSPGQTENTHGGASAGSDGNCWASTFTAIAAAFSTIGYWVQADLIDHLTLTSMGVWAPLLYIIAAFMGMMGVALGQPPRNYMWFFIGPVLYAWFLDTRVQVDGVAWVVATRHQDQREVWKNAEVGLINTNLYKRMVDDGETPLITANNMPELASPVRVALFFVWFDDLLSGTIQNLIDWTGLYNLYDNIDAMMYGAKTNINLQDGDYFLTGPEDKWHLISNLKWTYLDDITSAKVKSPFLRDSFATFMGSECGDAIAQSVDKAKFVQASNARGVNIPQTVFQNIDPGGSRFDYRLLRANLRLQSIPMPSTFKKMLRERGPRAFRHSIVWDGPGGVNYLQELLNADRIRCDGLLDALMYMFRWEAGEIYSSILYAQNIDQENIDANDIIYNLLYGWDIKVMREVPLITQYYGLEPFSAYEPLMGDTLSMGDMQGFVQNLILVYLLRNEIAMVPQPVTVRTNASAAAINYMEAYQRSAGSKSKFAEVYTWALMIPYIQGVLLYLLAIGYPIACVMMVVPGWHKGLFTWMGFYAWVKLWDLGFAIVMSLERTMWAMVGNGSHMARLFDRVVEMDSWGLIAERGGCPWEVGELAGAAAPAVCPHPALMIIDSAGRQAVAGSNIPFFDNLRIFDIGITLGANLDLDLANSYYIYIMSALYFAVPAITGQLVLGAKSGMSSMVNTAIGGVAQESGRLAGSGYQGDAVQRLRSNQASLGQAATAKGHRASGLAHRAIDAGNQAQKQSLAAAYNSEMGSGFDRLGNAAVLASQNNQRQADAGFALARFLTGAGDSNQPPQPREPGTGGQLPSELGKMGGGTGGEPKPDGNPAPAGPNARGGKGATSGAAGEASTAAFVNPLRLFAPALTDPTGKKGEGGFFFRAANLSNRSPGALSSAIQSGAGAAFGLDGAIANNESTALRGDAAIAGFGSSQYSSGLREGGSRLGAAANFGAQQARWEAMTTFASQLAGQSAAWGVHAGGLDPGAKPDDMTGMAMSGMLDTPTSRTRDAANFFNPNSGGYYGAVRRHQGQLQSAVGGSAVRSAFEQKGIYSATMEGIKRAGQGYGQAGQDLWSAMK